MNYIIRSIKESEIPLLDDFLYEAIFIPEWYTKAVLRDIIYSNPQIYAAVKDFGAYPDDCCVVAQVGGKAVGAVWARIADEYGHIDGETPSLAISVYKEYRKRGIGTALMKHMIELLREKGYKQVSLGVNKENYAVRMYENVGFKIIGDGADETEYLMLLRLQ